MVEKTDVAQISQDCRKMERVKFWLYCRRTANAAQHRSKARGLNCDIDAYAIDALLVQQGWRCAISGIRLVAPASASKSGRDAFAPSLVIHGGAQGADRIAREWCICRKVECRGYAADWKRHGRAAGPIRNQRMLDDGKPDLVIAFPGGRGTADMVRRAIATGIRAIEIPEATDHRG